MTKEVQEEDNSFAKAFGLSGDGSNWMKKYERIIRQFPFDDPVEPLDWIRRARKSRDLRFALLPENNITKVIEESFKTRITKPRRNAVYGISGLMNAGKSRFAATLAYKGKGYDANIEIKVCNTLDEMIDCICAQELPKHSILVRDEDILQTGEGSRIIEIDWTNILKILREYGYNIFFLFKYHTNIKIANRYFDMFGWNEATKESRVVVLGPTDDYLGTAIMKADYSEEWYNQCFQKMKDDTFERLKKSRGHQDAFSAFDINKAAERVQEAMQLKGLSLVKPKQIIEFMGMDDILANMNTISEVLKDKIATRVAILAMIQEPKRSKKNQDSSSPETGKSSVYCKLLKEYRDEAFSKWVFEELEGMDIPALQLDTFELVCQGMNYDHVGQQLGISKSTVGNYIKYIVENVLGYAGERAFDRRFTEQGRPHKMGGGNTADPDCICDDPLEVHTLKCFDTFRMNKVTTGIAKSEITFAQENQCPLIADTYEMSTGKFRIFSVIFQDEIHPNPPGELIATFAVKPLDTPSLPLNVDGPCSPPPAAAMGLEGGGCPKQLGRRHRR